MAWPKMSLRRSARISVRTVSPNSNSLTKETFSTVAVKKRSASGPSLPVAAKKARSTSKVHNNNNDSQTETATRTDAPALITTPVTPVRQRRDGPQRSRAPPLTPTPSLVNVIRAPYSTGDIDNASPPPDRPVEPHVTNATLVTPGGTRSVAYPDGLLRNSALPKPTATTSTLLDEACAHLVKVEPRLKLLIERHPCPLFSAKGLAEEIDPFRSLSSGIMNQQVSGAAARAIKSKFVALFHESDADGPTFPTPAQVAATDISRLRLAGLSQRKAEYIQGLAEKFASGELSNSMLMKASDEEVMEKLTAVRGLGKWSVEMFSCFGLKRLDILSTGDLGVQRGMAAFFGKDVQKLKAKGGKWKYMSEQDMLDKAAPFAPYRSLFMWYMWRVEDVDVSVMQSTA